MIRRLLLVIAVVLPLAASCSVPLDDDAQVIAQEELPERLQNTTTTTTTTTPVTPDTVDFAFYLLRDAADQERRFVVPIVRPVQGGLTFAETVGDLFAPDFKGPDDPEDVFNLLDVFELDSITQTDGVATVSLTVPPEEQLPQGTVFVDTLAQLVWTLVTGFDRIDSVEITINDEPRAAPTAEGPSDDPVTLADYERYDESFVPPTTTTTTTTSTTTAPPATIVPPDE